MYNLHFINFALIHIKFDFYSEFCSAGQQYDRDSKTCKNCPKDFYTNKTVSQYCIKCPTGYITYGEGSDSCIRLSVPGTDTAATLCKILYLSHEFSYAEEI